MTDRLAGKVCVVTGGAQGIGAAYATAMAAEGADVAVVDLTRIDQADAVRDEVERLGRPWSPSRSSTPSWAPLRCAPHWNPRTTPA